MTKYIYLYVNDQDISDLIEFFHNRNARIYDKYWTELHQMPYVDDRFPVFHIGYDKVNYIDYEPSNYTINKLQPGRLMLEDGKDKNINKLFSDIKKYIRKTYSIATNKDIYMGASMYKDWLVKKYIFPSLHKYHEFKLAPNNLINMINEILEGGYYVRNDRVDLNEVDLINHAGESFVIFSDKDAMITTTHTTCVVYGDGTKVIGNNRLFYEHGSECIRIFKMKKGKSIQVQVVLDERIAKNKECEMYVLFEKLKNKWEVTS